MFSVSRLSFQYHPNQSSVLTDISVDIPLYSFTTIIGANGAGKSTLLKLLTGLLKPTLGQISLQNQSLQQMTPGEIAKKIAYVPQQVERIFPLTVYELVAGGRTPHINWWGMLSDEDRNVIEQALRACEVLHVAGKPITELSGGEFQRAWIARAFAQQTDIILLDEPTVHLDIKHQMEFIHRMNEWHHEKKKTIIMIGHDLSIAANMSSHILLLQNGRVKAFGTADQVMMSDILSSAFDIEMAVIKSHGQQTIIQPTVKRI